MRYQGISNVQVLPQNVATAGFLLTWEPFDWGRRHNKVVEASKTIEQARNGIQETESQVAVEVGAKYRKWQEASLLLKASRTAHEAAVEKLRVTNNKYKQQASLLKDLLEAQARSSETNAQYQEAVSSYWSAIAELRKSMGKSSHENSVIPNRRPRKPRCSSSGSVQNFGDREQSSRKRLERSRNHGQQIEDRARISKNGCTFGHDGSDQWLSSTDAR